MRQGNTSGDQFYDAPMKFKGTQAKKSWNVSGFGNINDLRALQVSSNVYMFQTALKLRGQLRTKWLIGY